MRRALAVLVLAVAAAGCGRAPAAEGAAYEAICEVDDVPNAYGYVQNLSPGTLEVYGLVYFRFFAQGDTPSRSAIVLNASAFVPSGRRMLIVQTRLPFVVGPGEVCRFDVAGAVR